MKGKRTKYQKKLPWEVSRDLGFPHLGFQLTEEEIREGMANSRSCAEAARYMGISLESFKKYAEKYIDIETGKNLYELHKNVGFKNQKKPRPHKNPLPKLYKKQIDNLLVEQKWTNPRRVALLRNMMMLHKLHKDACEQCGYDESRMKDGKLPLMIHFINGDRKDWRIDNIKWLCYNCAFQMCSDPFTGRVLNNIQSSPIVGHESSEENNLLFYNLDQYFLNEIDNMQTFVEDGRYKEANDLIDYSEEADMQSYIDATKEYHKPDSFDLNDLIDRRV